MIISGDFLASPQFIFYQKVILFIYIEVYLHSSASLNYHLYICAIVSSDARYYLMLRYGVIRGCDLHLMENIWIQILIDLRLENLMRECMKR